MKQLGLSIQRATWLVLTPRVWLLVLRPAMISLLIWGLLGGALWYWQGDDLLAWLSTLEARWLVEQTWWGKIIGWLMQHILWLAMGLSLILLTSLTAILLVALFGMTPINQLVAQKYFPQLVAKSGLSAWQTSRNTMVWTAWFVWLWLLSLPTYLLAGLGGLVHMALMARFNQKVFVMDALANHASQEEFLLVSGKHNLKLFALGLLVTVLGALPTLVWVGSVFGIVFLPVTALLSVLTFTALMTYCGLLYSCYCLQALSNERELQQERLLQQMLRDV